MFKKKKLPQRKYHDGDITEFSFKPDSLDVLCQEIILIGVISGVSYEGDEIRYNVKLRDKNRGIFGDISVPENIISRRIGD